MIGNVPVFFRVKPPIGEDNAMNIAAGIKDVGLEQHDGQGVDFSQKSGPWGCAEFHNPTAVRCGWRSVVNFFIGLVFAIYITFRQRKAAFADGERGSCVPM